jgi:iron complex transport system substrate-binding protein
VRLLPRLLVLSLALSPSAALATGVQWLGPKPPTAVRRVVTVAPSLTESMVALGVADRLVGVSRFDDAKEVAQLPRVGGFSDPSVEAVLALKPDLVVVQMAPGNQKPIETLARLGVPVLALPLTTVAQVEESLTALGQVLGRVDAAARLVADIEAARARVRATAVKRGTRPRVMFVYGFKPLVVAGPGSFAHELLTDCGGVNVAEQAPSAYPLYSLERAVQLTPEVVIDAADVPDGRDEVRALGPLGNARWVQLPTLDLLHPGPRLARGLLVLSELLAPPSGPGRDAGR